MLKKLVLTLCLTFFFTPIVIASTQLYGHRGARGLSPENTLPAYQTALKIGVDYVDMDVGMTRDHQVVVYHDLGLNPNLMRDQNGHWVRTKTPIKAFTLRQLQTYDVGRLNPATKYASYFPSQQAVDHTAVSTLQDVIHYVKQHGGNKIGFQIEIKTDPAKPNDTFSPQVMAKAVADILQQENIIDRTEVQAFDWRVLLALQKINSKVATAYLTDRDISKDMHDKNPQIAGLWSAGKLLKNYHNSIPFMIASLGGKCWDAEDVEVNAKNLEEAHHLGLKVVTWSWPEKDGSELNVVRTKHVIRMGVDGVITDRPDKVKQLLTS